jgi:signal transduction histidine kinase
VLVINVTDFGGAQLRLTRCGPMDARGIPARLPRLAAVAVMAFSVVLAGVELGRIAVSNPHRDLVVAVVATALFLPFHVWHLDFGLRGRRPPRSGITLAVVAAAQVGALFLIGPAWSAMLAALATSALIVLPARGSIAVLALCLAGPTLAYLIRPELGATFNSDIVYPTYTVLFRAVIQFTLVWLVAAAYQLAATQAALAEEAVEDERARVEAEVRASLERGMGALVDASRRARDASALPGVAATLLAIDRVLELSRAAVDDLRRIISDARRPRPRPAASALARSARSARTPIGRGLAISAAWLPFAAVHAVVLAFPLLITTGAFGFGLHENVAYVVPIGLLIAALQLSLSVDVARGRRLPYPVVRWLLLLLLVVGVMAVLGREWRSAGWFVATAALLAFGRRGIVLSALAVVAVEIEWELSFIQNYPGRTGWYYTWALLYSTTIVLLVVFGLVGSAYLVRLLGDLDRARDALAEQAVHTERLRLSGDLHDVLSQTLTAISLKSDLARRVMANDPSRALAELDEVVALAIGQAGELEAVTRGEREIAFEAEATNAIELLRAADITVDAEFAQGELDPETSRLLGFAVREAATNILRHSDASRCSIRLIRNNGGIQLEIENDGARGRTRRGTGLSSLAERLSTQGGHAETELDGRRFRLSISLPERVTV